MKTCKWLPALTILLLSYLFAACGDTGLLNPVGGMEKIQPRNVFEQTCEGEFLDEEIPAVETGAVDILVVMDNSQSMAAEQALMGDAFPKIIESLLTGRDLATGEQVHAPVYDLHIGVVSTDMGVGGYAVTTCENDPLLGDDGFLQHAPRGPDCDPAYPDYLSYEIGPRADPDIAQVQKLAGDFGCIALLGTSGCGFEQQLEAACKALIDHSVPGGANAGFLRDDSIILIRFVTDEEDCSAADVTIFDLSIAPPYSINLRCHYEAAKLHPIDRYVDAFRGLRQDPDKVVLGFIVGVPPDEPDCNGRGNEIDRCLYIEAMQETVRPDGDLLEYVCRYPSTCTPPEPPDPGDCISEAFPARRFVELAQQFGENAVVHSICTGDYTPAMAALTEKLQTVITAQAFISETALSAGKDPTDPCRCLADCVVYEILSDDGDCPLGKPYYDRNGDGAVPDYEIDHRLNAYTLCELPQAGTIINGGVSCDAACNDPGAVYSINPDIDGWWYHPFADSGLPERHPTIFLDAVAPEYGSRVVIECCL